MWCYELTTNWQLSNDPTDLHYGCNLRWPWKNVSSPGISKNSWPIVKMTDWVDAGGMRIAGTFLIWFGFDNNRETVPSAPIAGSIYWLEVISFTRLAHLYLVVNCPDFVTVHLHIQHNPTCSIYFLTESFGSTRPMMEFTQTCLSTLASAVNTTLQLGSKMRVCMEPP